MISAISSFCIRQRNGEKTRVIVYSQWNNEKWKWQTSATINICSFVFKLNEIDGDITAARINFYSVYSTCEGYNGDTRTEKVKGNSIEEGKLSSVRLHKEEWYLDKKVQIIFCNIENYFICYSKSLKKNQKGCKLETLYI